MYNYSNELNGSLEDLNISDITSPTNPLRSTMNNLEELAESINKIGLLQPIIVRTNSSENFEIVAGNRRFNACKKLGKRKIACHIVEIDDKKAFEVSMIENVQRHSLNPIDESIAFRKYVEDFGWGGISELSQKLSKSTSYICKRMKLLELPNNIIDLISKSEMHVTVAEELLHISDKRSQSNLTELIQDEHLSSRMVRKIVKGMKTKPDRNSLSDSSSKSDNEIIHRSFDKAIIALRISTKKLATIIENLDDRRMLHDILMQHKHMLHQQVDLLIREKRKYRKNSLILHNCL
jgi:ParB family transcriptional regulator, chromosome partitioning protein